MKTYEMEIKVIGSTRRNGQPIIGLTYFVHAENSQQAGIKGLLLAAKTKARHPRIYKNAEFNVDTVKEVF